MKVEKFIDDLSRAHTLYKFSDGVYHNKAILFRDGDGDWCFAAGKSKKNGLTTYKKPYRKLPARLSKFLNEEE